MSSDEAWDVQQRVLEMVTPALAAEYDASQPDRMAFVLCTAEMTEAALAAAIQKAGSGARRSSPIQWGWAPRAAMAESLTKSGMEPLAAEIAAGRGVEAGHVQCVIMLNGVATVANLPVEALAAPPATAPGPLASRPDQKARNRAKAERRARSRGGR
jgi:hypothetical protein